MVPLSKLKVTVSRALVIVIKYSGEYAALTNCSIVYCRSTKRPVRYIEAEVLCEEDGSDTEVVSQETTNETNMVTMPSPIKKSKVTNKEKKGRLIEDKESTDVIECEVQESSKTKKSKKEAKKKKASKKKKGKKGKTTRCLLKILLIIIIIHLNIGMFYTST